MVKKKGKEQEPPAKDEFDPLELVSKKPQTVVLMLNSEEHGVLQAACEALFRYSKKCEENVKLLSSLGALDYLLPLVSHSEKTVKRGAVMCLGVMSAEASVQKSLREGNWIASLVNLLAQDEEAVFHEYSSLALSHLAGSYSSKAAILENGGLEQLILLLSSHDCDVQKNVAETLSLLLQDYRCCLAFIGLSGIEPLVKLLDSDYPVIQQLSLLTLDSISKIGSSLAILREGGYINKLVDIVGNKEFDDLHIAALKVLANCLQDTETLQIVQEAGLIDSLMAFIAETNISDVQVYAVQVITRVAQNERNRKIFNEQQIEKTLSSMFSSENTAVFVPVAESVAVMAENASSCDAMAKMDIISHLLSMLKGDCVDGKEAAMKAINHLTSNNAAIKNELFEKNGLELIVRLLDATGSPSMLMNSASCLSSFAQNDTWRTELGKLGLIFNLVNACSTSYDPDVQCCLCQCLAVFLSEDWARQDFNSVDGCQLLRQLIATNYENVRQSACWVLSVACQDGVIARQLSKSGALQVLLEINQSEARRSSFTANALEALLSNDLSAKYGIANHLDAMNLIMDDFYDAGRMRSGHEMPDLRDLISHPVNDKRATIFVSTQKIQARRRTSKGTGAHLQQLQQEEAEEGDDNCDMIDIPRDDNFISCVENIQQDVAKQRDPREQITTIARMVSNQMGGPISRDDLGSFHYELHISELKQILGSNVIPIGMIEKGFYYHRALMFKALADRAQLSCSLVRGSYGRAWNVVSYCQQDQDGKVSLPPTEFIVDLVHNPGDLLPRNSAEALRYQRV